MHQAFIVCPMFVSGIALFGSAAWIQANRAALTDIRAEDGAPLRATVSALEAPAAVEVEERWEPIVVELAPIEIVGRSRVASRVSTLPPAQAVAEPCSEWSEIGPERVLDGSGFGARHVRELCARFVPNTRDQASLLGSRTH